MAIRMYTITQAAQILGVSRSAIAKRIERRSISAQKCGNQWEIPDYVVDEMTRDGKWKPGPKGPHASKIDPRTPIYKAYAPRRGPSRVEREAAAIEKANRGKPDPTFPFVPFDIPTWDELQAMEAE